MRARLEATPGARRAAHAGGIPRAARCALSRRARRLDRAAVIHSTALLVAACVMAAARRARAHRIFPHRRHVAGDRPRARRAQITNLPEGTPPMKTPMPKIAPPSFPAAPRRWINAQRTLETLRAENAARAAAARAAEAEAQLPAVLPRPDLSPRA